MRYSSACIVGLLLASCASPDEGESVTRSVEPITVMSGGSDVAKKTQVIVTPTVGRFDAAPAAANASIQVVNAEANGISDEGVATAKFSPELADQIARRRAQYEASQKK